MSGQSNDRCIYDYAVIRVVPRVEREEFLNVGVILSCPAKKFLEARIELDEARLLAFAPWLDLDSIRPHLAAIPAICAGGAQAGPIGQLTQRERFHWLIAPRSTGWSASSLTLRAKRHAIAPRSTIIQTSPAHTGACRNPGEALERLLDTMVRPQPLPQREPQ